jgi:hypothetical protein
MPEICLASIWCDYFVVNEFAYYTNLRALQDKEPLTSLLQSFYRNLAKPKPAETLLAKLLRFDG